MSEARRRSRQLGERRRARSSRRLRETNERHGSLLPGWLAAGAVAIVMALGAALWIFGLPGSEAGGGDSPAAPVGRDPITVAGVEVLEPMADFGHIPLETPVEHAFKLRNTSAETVMLGEASITVLEGC